MRRYKALQAVTFRNGQFKLTPEQFARRQYVVNLLDKDELIVEPGKSGEISFKAGELITTDIQIEKGQGHALEALDGEPVAAAAPSQASVPADAGEASTTAESSPVAETQDAAPGSEDPLAGIDETPPPAGDQRSTPRRGRR